MTVQGLNQRGFMGSTRYDVLENIDMLAEIAEWESVETRVVHLPEASSTEV